MIGATGSLLDLVLVTRGRPRLPLHVAGRIGAATLQGLDVVNHVALARPGSLAGCRTWMAGLEGSPGLRTPCNPSVGGRPQEVHFVVDGIRVCGEVERRSERTADRG